MFNQLIDYNIYFSIYLMNKNRLNSPKFANKQMLVQTSTRFNHDKPLHFQKIIDPIPHNNLIEINKEPLNSYNAVQNKKYQEKFTSSFAPPVNLRSSKSPLNFTQQHIDIMELNFQATIRGYDMKLKSLTEQYRRNKQQAQIKIKELVQQKNHWQNLAKKFQESKQLLKNQKNKESQALKVEKLQKQKQKIIHQKQELKKELKFIVNQNAVLKQKIVELQKNQQAKPNSRSHSFLSHNRSPLKISAPLTPLIQPNPKQLEISKISNEKMKNLINDLNNNIISLKIKELNQKYEKQEKCVQQNGQNIRHIKIEGKNIVTDLKLGKIQIKTASNTNNSSCPSHNH